MLLFLIYIAGLIIWFAGISYLQWLDPEEADQDPQGVFFAKVFLAGFVWPGVVVVVLIALPILLVGSCGDGLVFVARKWGEWLKKQHDKEKEDRS